MKLYLLDTSVLIALFSKKSSPSCLAFLQNLKKKSASLSTCGIVLSEFYRGVSPREAEKYSFYLDQLRYLHSSKSIYEKAGLLAGGLSKKGIKISLADCVIAAVAQYFQATVVTFDNDFKFIPKLQFIMPRI